MRVHETRIPSDLSPQAGTGVTLAVHEPHCEHCGGCQRDRVVMKDDLEAFVSGTLQRHGVPAHEGDIVARVLVAADLRGIPSHGVARLGRYIDGIKKGFIVPGIEFDVLEPLPAMAVVDARNGLGQVVSEMAMDLAITKARRNGVGVVTVKHSNHYGIAGYYALKAVEAGMIGISLTNSAPLVVPTHGAEVLLGTNPISFGAPTRAHPAFLLDMATSVVPRGKLEVYDRNAKQMPVGWALDEEGFDCQNPGQVLKNLVDRLGGGILPLGGRGELYSGYKGYGLAFMVDVLCGVLSGAAYGPGVDNVHQPSGDKGAPDVGHFFLALDVGRFMPLDAFQDRLDDYIHLIKSSKTALDQEVIYIHGEKEHTKAACHLEEGIPLARNVYDTLARIADACGHPHPRLKTDS